MKEQLLAYLQNQTAFFSAENVSERYCREVFSQEKHDQSLFESANGRRSFSENCDPTRLFFS